MMTRGRSNVGSAARVGAETDASSRHRDGAPSEEAFEAWLTPSSVPAESGERATDPVSEERLIERALSGHSPSARALANVSDQVVALAGHASQDGLTHRGHGPSMGLRDRILRDVASIPPPTFRSASAVLPSPVSPKPTPGALVSAPNEALGRLHAKHADEARRIEIIDRHGMRGGVGQEATDRALHLLIRQYSPFIGFEVVFVSTVVGDVTVHRVHRGFPAEFGNIDVVPRELSFCTHTVSSAEPLIVEDAAKEAFFRQSDLVQKFGCRAYLGVPLFANEVALGALCGISFSPQVIFPEDVSLAQRFARIAQALVTHDEAELEMLVVEPARYPTDRDANEAQGLVVLSREAFMSIVEAQRQRIGVASSTLLLRVPASEWAEVSATLPTTLVAGELEARAGEGAVRGVLLPEDHPDFADLPSTPRLKALLDEAERLG